MGQVSVWLPVSIHLSLNKQETWAAWEEKLKERTLWDKDQASLWVFQEHDAAHA